MPILPQAFLEAVHKMEHVRLFRILIFLALYGLGAIAAIAISQATTGVLGVLICLPFYLLAAASLHGISLFAHEGVHGLISKNRWLNDGIASVCAWPVLQQFSAYRVLHIRHHRALGNDEDPDHYANYTKRKGLIFCMHWGRLLLGYPVYITLIPLLGWVYGSWRDRIQIFVELIVLLGIGVLIYERQLPFYWFLHAWILPMIMIHFMVNIRGMSQHTLLEHAPDQILGTRTITTNSVTQFFMCNENFHLEHHVYPGVPWYHLPKVHHALKSELIDRGAPFIPSYTAFVKAFVLASITRRPSGSVDLSHL